MGAKQEPDLSELALDLCIGDLVRLKEDIEMKAGLGIITKVKRGSEDLFDLLDIIREDSESELNSFLSKPKICVVWNKEDRSIPMWMDVEEISVVRSRGISVVLV